ncbi:MAG: hypothetical protein A2571_03320 [Candidatus Vogelbacteria bacterium RIFOXYD1_FULL_44_32]|uniref:ATP-grasp domain-containing protein n=1 Tax=Candidatus Vogelbacteria bacterium RIFOXYD1_FULL_44_32 TaxID=1802438 RepID=A0A1G2QDZ7_9BACT|nr:MAG: hypothetical protein A2571_03320 [Candidatus Vogelbacteria bacterium RIFOXYD1_FULL_44_32]
MKKKKRNTTPLVGTLLQEIAPLIGAKVLMEPTWGIVGQIVYKSGRKRYIRYNTVDLNPVGASDIAKDKDWANFFMKKMGYPTVPGEAFYADWWCKAIGSERNLSAAYQYAKKIGFPVVVKPNSGSQGTGVAFVHNRREFYEAMRYIFTRDKIALVQRPIAGKDYRLVILDGELISAYERQPLSVTGDGRLSIRALLRKKQENFIASSRDTKIKVRDPRIAGKLARQGLAFSSVPKLGEVVYLLDNANLSTGGDSVDVTGAVHPEFKKIAIRLTADMGLRMCGVDLMVKSDITKAPGRYTVIEINAAPGLDHYAASGKKQEEIVKRLYLKVLKSLEKGL